VIAAPKVEKKAIHEPILLMVFIVFFN
jgi:hypothetical protein